MAIGAQNHLRAVKRAAHNAGCGRGDLIVDALGARSVPRMTGWLTRLVNAGFDSPTPAENRRVRAINLVAMLAIFVNVAYGIGWALLDFTELRPLILTNTVSVIGMSLVIYLNHRGLTNPAMWLLVAVGLFNTTAAALLMGLDTGGFLFIIIIPVTAVFLVRSNDLGTQVVLIGAGVVAMVGVVLIDPPPPTAIQGTAIETALLVSSIAVTVIFVCGVVLYSRRLADNAEVELEIAKQRSEELLLNILPHEIADRLKAGEVVIADRAEHVSVLFADLVDSTPMSEQLTPRQMVEVLNELFTPFDDLADVLGLEKIKTIGDAYMVVGGLPVERADHLEAIAEMALRMQEEVAKHSVANFGALEMRYGIHTGPVVAGVIGKRKFSYDLWGDTVNTAARMESHGVPGRIQVTAAVCDGLAGTYRFEKRGPVEIKGKGMLTTYFLMEGQSPTPSNDEPQV
jgi:class 3 adenylate cyclase